MKNLKKITRAQLKTIKGGISSINPVKAMCVYECCPSPGLPICADADCGLVHCPHMEETLK